MSTLCAYENYLRDRYVLGQSVHYAAGSSSPKPKSYDREGNEYVWSDEAGDYVRQVGGPGGGRTIRLSEVEKAEIEQPQNVSTQAVAASDNDKFHIKPAKFKSSRWFGDKNRTYRVPIDVSRIDSRGKQAIVDTSINEAVSQLSLIGLRGSVFWHTPRFTFERTVYNTLSRNKKLQNILHKKLDTLIDEAIKRDESKTTVGDVSLALTARGLQDIFGKINKYVPGDFSRRMWPGYDSALKKAWSYNGESFGIKPLKTDGGRYFSVAESSITDPFYASFESAAIDPATKDDKPAPQAEQVNVDSGQHDSSVSPAVDEKPKRRPVNKKKKPEGSDAQFDDSGLGLPGKSNVALKPGVAENKDAAYFARRDLEGATREAKTAPQNQEGDASKALSDSEHWERAQASLPSLRGTEKQVKWADDIRRKAFNRFYWVGAWTLLRNKSYLHAKRYSRDISKYMVDEAIRQFFGSRDSAKFWIDNREDIDHVVNDSLLRICFNLDKNNWEPTQEQIEESDRKEALAHKKLDTSLYRSQTNRERSIDSVDGRKFAEKHLSRIGQLSDRQEAVDVAKSLKNIAYYSATKGDVDVVTLCKDGVSKIKDMFGTGRNDDVLQEWTEKLDRELARANKNQQKLARKKTPKENVSVEERAEASPEISGGENRDQAASLDDAGNDASLERKVEESLRKGTPLRKKATRLRSKAKDAALKGRKEEAAGLRKQADEIEAEARKYIDEATNAGVELKNRRAEASQETSYNPVENADAVSNPVADQDDVETVWIKKSREADEDVAPYVGEISKKLKQEAAYYAKQGDVKKTEAVLKALKTFSEKWGLEFNQKFADARLRIASRGGVSEDNAASERDMPIDPASRTTHPQDPRYYPIDEEQIRVANSITSHFAPPVGTETKKYRELVDKAIEAGELRKKEVDARYHADIDKSVKRYAKKLADWLNKKWKIIGSYGSSYVVGSGNYSTRKHDQKHRRLDAHNKGYAEVEELFENISRIGVPNAQQPVPETEEPVEKPEVSNSFIPEQQPEPVAAPAQEPPAKPRPERWTPLKSKMNDDDRRVIENTRKRINYGLSELAWRLGNAKEKGDVQHVKQLVATAANHYLEQARRAFRSHGGAEALAAFDEALGGDGLTVGQLRDRVVDKFRKIAQMEANDLFKFAGERLDEFESFAEADSEPISNKEIHLNSIRDKNGKWEDLDDKNSEVAVEDGKPTTLFPDEYFGRRMGSERGLADAVRRALKSMTRKGEYRDSFKNGAEYADPKYNIDTPTRMGRFLAHGYKDSLDGMPVSRDDYSEQRYQELLEKFPTDRESRKLNNLFKSNNREVNKLIKENEDEYKQSKNKSEVVQRVVDGIRDVLLERRQNGSVEAPPSESLRNGTTGEVLETGGADRPSDGGDGRDNASIIAEEAKKSDVPESRVREELDAPRQSKISPDSQKAVQSLRNLIQRVYDHDGLAERIKSRATDAFGDALSAPGATGFESTGEHDKHLFKLADELDKAKKKLEKAQERFDKKPDSEKLERAVDKAEDAANEIEDRLAQAVDEFVQLHGGKSKNKRPASVAKKETPALASTPQENEKPDWLEALESQEELKPVSRGKYNPHAKPYSWKEKRPETEDELREYWREHVDGGEDEEVSFGSDGERVSVGEQSGDAPMTPDELRRFAQLRHGRELRKSLGLSEHFSEKELKGLQEPSEKRGRGRPTKTPSEATQRVAQEAQKSEVPKEQVQEKIVEAVSDSSNARKLQTPSLEEPGTVTEQPKAPTKRRYKDVELEVSEDEIRDELRSNKLYDSVRRIYDSFNKGNLAFDVQNLGFIAEALSSGPRNARFLIDSVNANRRYNNKEVARLDDFTGGKLTGALREQVKENAANILKGKGRPGLSKVASAVGFELSPKSKAPVEEFVAGFERSMPLNTSVSDEEVEDAIQRRLTRAQEEHEAKLERAEAERKRAEAEEQWRKLPSEYRSLSDYARTMLPVFSEEGPYQKETILRNLDIIRRRHGVKGLKSFATIIGVPVSSKSRSANAIMEDIATNVPRVLENGKEISLEPQDILKRHETEQQRKTRTRNTGVRNAPNNQTLSQPQNSSSPNALSDSAQQEIIQSALQEVINVGKSRFDNVEGGEQFKRLLDNLGSGKHKPSEVLAILKQQQDAGAEPLGEDVVQDRIAEAVAGGGASKRKRNLQRSAKPQDDSLLGNKREDSISDEEARRRIAKDNRDSFISAFNSIPKKAPSYWLARQIVNEINNWGSAVGWSGKKSIREMLKKLNEDLRMKEYYSVGPSRLDSSAKDLAARLGIERGSSLDYFNDLITDLDRAWFQTNPENVGFHDITSYRNGTYASPISPQKKVNRSSSRSSKNFDPDSIKDDVEKAVQIRDADRSQLSVESIDSMMGIAQNVSKEHGVDGLRDFMRRIDVVPVAKSRPKLLQELRAFLEDYRLNRYKATFIRNM